MPANPQMQGHPLFPSWRQVFLFFPRIPMQDPSPVLNSQKSISNPLHLHQTDHPKSKPFGKKQKNV
jgi:hypothetical protein